MGLSSPRRGPGRSQGFTLGWVPPALQAEAHAREGRRRAASVPGVPRVSPWAGFRRPFRPRHKGGAGRDARYRSPARSGESQGFTLGCVPSALQAETPGGAGRDARGRASARSGAPGVSPWAAFRRPFRPRHMRGTGRDGRCRAPARCGVPRVLLRDELRRPWRPKSVNPRAASKAAGAEPRVRPWEKPWASNARTLAHLRSVPEITRAP